MTADANSGGRLVSVQPELDDGTKKITAQLTRSLAEAARFLWPDWYDGSMRLDFDADSSVRPAIDRLATRQMLRRRRGISGEWLTAAWHACQSGRTPLVPQLSLSVQAEQLSLALADENLLFAIILTEAAFNESALLALSRSAEWLARETDAKVVVVVPESLRSRPELDGISSSPIPLETTYEHTPALRPADAFAVCDSGEELKHVVCPILGRPHPASPGEQKLAARLASDPELADLFRFNERVATVFESRYLVDLVWPKGRVVVEVDGYGYHSSPAAFHADRHRDYELTLSGYVVLRLPHDSVVADVDLAVERIREFVSFRTSHPFVESEIAP
jgi:very-short-patch-repair endonuclease